MALRSFGPARRTIGDFCSVSFHFGSRGSGGSGGAWFVVSGCLGDE